MLESGRRAHSGSTDDGDGRDLAVWRSGRHMWRKFFDNFSRLSDRPTMCDKTAINSNG